MTRVLLTGGSGFIASHVLDLLLKRGYSVVTTVRSQDKADKIKASYQSNYDNGQLDFAIVQDIAQLGAFDQAVVSEPPFDVVVHTASPCHFNITDVKKDLLDPAMNGTVGILKSVKAHAPSVKHVVYTSSFSAIMNPGKGDWPGHAFSEADWNPITEEEAYKSPLNGYRGSKTFAERAAWEFMEKEKPNFTFATINPPVVVGPVIHSIDSLDKLNTSNQGVLKAASGKWKDVIQPTGVYLWVDVRDVAEAHIQAFEKPEAANKRFFTTAGVYSNKEIAAIIKKHFPELKDLATESTPGGDYPESSRDALYTYNNKRTVDILGLQYMELERSIVDTVKSFQGLGL
ncbi:NAD(P)-binding protein [Aaosphaeria arxii CBS 175.79]|uniref:NAD(P)-binding protein n=1 Tax=Aaosphaeria arxii CBS 175.79 TaxID=1450172 RepID=A0A6A5XTN9_9PLEO|nr:NAD(P)-binding protein [Aaosphaeria arxii CBS 175.79]KAF2016276.1 NAD(P)-binding protein [Aaosphaeria arxii CBS 175.79]